MDQDKILYKELVDKMLFDEAHSIQEICLKLSISRPTYLKLVDRADGNISELSMRRIKKALINLGYINGK